MRNRFTLLLAVAAVLLFYPTQRAVADDINADRPGIADSGAVVEPSTLQAEGGVERQTSEGARDDTIPLLLRYGLTKHVELRLESDTVSRERRGDATDRGLSPVAIGAKWQLVEGGDSARLQDFGFIGSVTLPSGSSVFRQEKATAFVTTAADVKIAGNWSANPNAGLSQYHDSENRSHVAPFFALTTEDDVTERIHPAIEVARVPPDEGEDHGKTIVDAQCAWIVTSSTQLDIEAGRDVHDAHDRYVTAGISVRLTKGR